MNIKWIEWRNFNSYGNATQRIDFGANGLYNLIGKNGSGKTTIAEVIEFAAFGKVSKKNKSDVVNRINKSMWTRICMDSRGKRIEISRGAAPNVFDVEIDGTRIDTAGNSNVQSYLEDELYEIPYAVFKNLLVLSIDDFKSFITMNTSDKRNIVDKLFGFSILNEMLNSLKSERKDIKESIRTTTAELSAIEETIESISSRIERAKSQKAEDRTKLLDEINSKMAQAQTELKTVSDSLSKAEHFINTQSKSIRTMDVKRASILAEQKVTKEKLNLLSKDRCPYCSSQMDSPDHAAMKETCANRASQLQSDLESIANDYRKASDAVAKLKGTHSALFSKRNSHESSLARMKMEIKQLSNPAEDVASLEAVHIESSSKKTERKDKIETLASEDSFLQTVEGVLGEEGIKGQVMKTVVPALNQTVAAMCTRLHVPYSIHFDEKFECHVQSMGESISPRSMSSGERVKADLAVIVALIKVMKMRFPNLNLMFIDEIYRSVDSEGIFEITKILNEMSKDHGLNVWVMHHAPLPTEFFDKIVSVVKDGGFSRVHIEST
jgi:DNA repair exonuclease SbcCD ATPase subunit